MIVINDDTPADVTEHIHILPIPPNVHDETNTNVSIVSNDDLQTITKESRKTMAVKTFTSIMCPAMKSLFSYKTKDDALMWKQGKLLNCAGKVSGKYRDFVNIEDTEASNIACINWIDEVLEWQPIDEHITLIIGSKIEDHATQYVKHEELEKWKKFNVYKEIDDDGQQVISSCWACTEKHTEGKIVKARLVAGGYEECNK